MVKHKEPKRPKRWFKLDGETRSAERTLAQQLQGLDHLLAVCKNKTVLDVGCAEGLIGITALEHGASHLRGFDSVAERVYMARSLAAMKGYRQKADFWVDDAAFFDPSIDYNIILLLAILHKLADPETACRRYAKHAKMMIIRIPPENAPYILDARSGYATVNLNEVMLSEGFTLERVTRGAFAEWCGYFVKE